MCCTNVMAHMPRPAGWTLYFLNTKIITPELISIHQPHSTGRFKIPIPGQ